MAGSKWEDLKIALRNALSELQVRSRFNQVSVINFSSDSTIEVEFANPNDVNVDILQFKGKGTDFELALNSANHLLDKCTHNIIDIIFMTDGEASFPEKGVKYINMFKNVNTKKKILFNTIEFQCNNGMMDRLNKALEGKKYCAQNGEQLMNVYREIVIRPID